MCRFYECAAAAYADFIVTGNTRHFPKARGKTRIITIRQLLELVGV
jgi:predicted nucleic acid-binding protein